MNICGIDFPENAKFEFFGSPYGTDLSRVARLYVYNNGERPKLYHIIELVSELKDENALSAERCFIKFVENQNGNQEGAYAEIISGEFKNTTLFLKIENKKN